MRRLLAVLIVGLVLLPAAAFGQADPEANDPGFWCEPGQGLKIEPVATPFVVPVPEEGTTWTLLVLKGGTTNETVSDPIPGQGYSHSTAANSHVILCWEPTQVTTTTVDTTTTTSTTSTSTTLVVSTTTTDPVTTTSSSTSTTDPTTTTLPSDCSSTCTPETTTTSTVPPTTSTTLPILPVTGFDNVPLTLAAAALIIIGLAVLTGTYLHQRDD